MKSFAAATMLSLASSATALNFLATAVHSGDFRVHQKSINANGLGFWINKNTTTYCPDSIEAQGGCPVPPYGGGNVTAFVAPAPDQDSLSMDTEVPGGQVVYVEPSDGHLAFSAAHSAPPADAILTGFKYTPIEPQTSKDEAAKLMVPGNATACPDGQGNYQIFSDEFYAGAVPKEQCIVLGIQTLQTVDGAVAWQYI